MISSGIRLFAAPVVANGHGPRSPFESEHVLTMLPSAQCSLMVKGIWVWGRFWFAALLRKAQAATSQQGHLSIAVKSNDQSERCHADPQDEVFAVLSSMKAQECGILVTESLL